MMRGKRSLREWSFATTFGRSSVRRARQCKQIQTPSCSGCLHKKVPCSSLALSRCCQCFLASYGSTSWGFCHQVALENDMLM